MELFLIAVLAIAFLILWNRTGNALDRTRDHMNRLGQEVEFLRNQLAAVVRTATKPEEPKPAQAANVAAPAAAPFTAPASPTPVEPNPPPAEPIATQPHPHPTATPAPPPPALS